MKNFKNDIKNGTYKSVYLFYGDEDYLREYYEKEAVNKIAGDYALTDFESYEGKGFTPDILTRVFTTPPFMAERRLALFRETGVFAAGRKDDADKTEKIISKILKEKDLPNVVIFSESKIDKRGKLYKTVEKSGGAVEFKAPSERELTAWVAGLIKKNGGMISAAAAVKLIGCSADMNSLKQEAEKLAAYKNGVEITEKDVDLLCEKSIDAKIFDLIGAIGAKKQGAAVGMYEDLISEKESPLHVLILIARQIGIIMRTKELSEKKINANEIAVRLGLRSFAVFEALKQAKLFTENYLKKAYAECLDTDYGIKTGRIDEKLGVELLIVKYSGEI